MPPPAQHRRRFTVAQWQAQLEERRFELIDGELVEKAAPDAPHGNAQAGVTSLLRGPFHRKPGGAGPGGWWILTEVDVQVGDDVVRPDVAGWRRERVPALPTERPIGTRPDWICEIVSPSHRANDTVVKLRSYHLAAIAHYWLLDPVSGTLTVLRYGSAGYVQVLAAQRHEVVRAEPFEQLEVRVGVLLGEDPDE